VKKELHIKEKIQLVTELDEHGLAFVIPKYKISYGTAIEIKEEVAKYSKAKPKQEKLSIEYKKASSILTPGKGFMDMYDYTLNPYSGCAFGCTYCYAAFFSRSETLRENWGHWLQVKENAIDLLSKYRKKGLTGKTIYMSSVTDPYQPIEKELKLTRGLLTELGEFHQPRLVIQTRSPMLTRDIDLLQKLKTVQVNMTITTDSEKVRKVFEPLCPSNELRLKAIKKVNEAGINTCITLTPLLPVENATNFARKLLATGVSKFVVQSFHSEKGKFVASTGERALKLVDELGWDNRKYNKVIKILLGELPNVTIGKSGFKPI
jgi:DNA repair photolyase